MRSGKGWGRRAGLLGVLAFAGAAIASCKNKAADIGQPCVPADEYSTAFSGFDEDEVNIGTGNRACSGDAVCLVNHFRGRVSCPYGQTEDDIQMLPGDNPSRCVVPNTSGNEKGEAIDVPVRPQLADRRPKDAVYCSCRCANASGKAGSGDCTCPSGYSCTPLVEDIGLGSKLAGSYCIKSGTAWNDKAPPGPWCDIDAEDCGDPRPTFDVPAPHPGQSSTNQFVEQIVMDSINKIDLLFMIDNSIAMADKQEILAQAVPQLLSRLIDPLCEDEEGNLVAKFDSACPPGTTEEFYPIPDIHIGVVSSSLGGHGGELCSPAAATSADLYDPAQDDRGELIAPLRGVDSYNNLGFLKWDPNAAYDPPGEADAEALVEAFTELVTATGETGCGYEAGLESWYRFLIDPQPPVAVTRDGDYSTLGEVNTTLLEQRAWFLRPDSLVAVIMLSDENDCSIRDDGVSWLVGAQRNRIPRGTQACLTNPNDPCCRSCALYEASPPPGCNPLDSDPNCTLPAYTATEESLNLRCFDQKRRFGLDFLYPWWRYVDGLQLSVVLGRDCRSDDDCPAYEDTSGNQVQAAGACVDGTCEYVNPLNATSPYYPRSIPRPDASLVFLAGIVGVPWQDIATDASLEDPDVLEFLQITYDPNNPGATLADRWDAILGEPDIYMPPLDPFMIESVDPRDGLGLSNPIVGLAPQPTTAAVDVTNINGHEYTIAERDDLQYACIFELDTPRDCASATGGCDCKTVDASNPTDKPLCQEPGTNDSSSTQHYAKAYPGIRFLEVLKEYGMNSIVASVCPKITDSARSQEPAYGYSPAMKAIVDRLKEKLHSACLPRSLPVRDDGTLACQIVEATNPSFDVNCGGPGRGEVDPALDDVVRRKLEESARCGDGEGQIPCGDMTLCRVKPAKDRGACLNDVDLGAGPLAGYCYIDAMQDRDDDGQVDCEYQGDPDCIGNPDLVAACEASQRRILRIVSVGVDPQVPYPTSVLFVACESRL